MYAQYEEDIFLENYFKDRIGFLCDIGASDGIRYSNSRYLIEKGWQGLLIEPNPTAYSKLQLLYKDNSKITTVSECCYKTNKDVISFYCDTYDGFGQISTMDLDFKEKCEKAYQPAYIEHKVKCSKTSDIFNRYNIKSIVFLSIDCEGVDLEVLQGINFNEVNIELICIENRDNKISEHMQLLDFKKVFSNIGNDFYAKY